MSSKKMKQIKREETLKIKCIFKKISCVNNDLKFDWVTPYRGFTSVAAKQVYTEPVKCAA